MHHTYSALTRLQSARAGALYARLLALSRERRGFVCYCRAAGWPASHVAELWVAHAARKGFML